MECRVNLPGTKKENYWRPSYSTSAPFPAPPLCPSPASDVEFSCPHETHLMTVAQGYLHHPGNSLYRVYAAPPSVDANEWIYEHLRLFILELNRIVALMADECTRAGCPKMTYEEWSFLCAAHKTPSEDCPARDYMTHTLDDCQTLLTLKRHLPPNRGGGGHRDVLEGFNDRVRRLYRILAHLSHSHRPVFRNVEAASRVCLRFTFFGVKWQLMPAAKLLIPAAVYMPGDAMTSIPDVAPILMSAEEERRRAAGETSTDPGPNRGQGAGGSGGGAAMAPSAGLHARRQHHQKGGQESRPQNWGSQQKNSGSSASQTSHPAPPLPPERPLRQSGPSTSHRHLPFNTNTGAGIFE